MSSGLILTSRLNLPSTHRGLQDQLHELLLENGQKAFELRNRGSDTRAVDSQHKEMITHQVRLDL